MDKDRLALVEEELPLEAVQEEVADLQTLAVAVELVMLMLNIQEQVVQEL
jgi:hypothetical protein